MIKKSIFNYGPISGSRAIESEFDQSNFQFNAKPFKVSVKQALRSFKKDSARLSVEEYPHKNRILALVHSITDQINFETCKYLNQNQKKVACMEGCYACCYYSKINAVGLEFEEIVNYVQTKMPEDTRQALLSQIVDFPDYKKSDYKPCPFLSIEQGSCSIYSVRPITCRHFGSVTRCELDDPENDGFSEFQSVMASIIRAIDVKPGQILIIQEEARKGKNKVNIHRDPGETVNLKIIEHERLEKLFG